MIAVWYSLLADYDLGIFIYVLYIRKYYCWKKKEGGEHLGPQAAWRCVTIDKVLSIIIAGGSLVQCILLLLRVKFFLGNLWCQFC